LREPPLKFFRKHHLPPLQCIHCYCSQRWVCLWSVSQGSSIQISFASFLPMGRGSWKSNTFASHILSEKLIPLSHPASLECVWH
jgi:hypothetical protein